MDEKARERRKAKRENDIQQKREEHQQAIKKLTKNYFLSRGSQLRRTLRYEIDKEHKENFQYRKV